MPYRRFSVKDVAAYLHLSTQDVEELVRSGGIPFERQGARPVFLKKDIDAWASQRILGLSKQRLEGFHRKTSAQAHNLSQNHAIVGELLKTDLIEPGLSSRTKPSVIRDMAALAEKTGLVIYPEEFVKSLREREELCATALPGGLALLHPRHHDPYMFSDSFIVAARAVHAVHFGSPDGKPTDLFFLVCCQDDRIHLHVLARLCMMCVQTPMLTALRVAADRTTMAKAMVKAEQDVILKL